MCLKANRKGVLWEIRLGVEGGLQGGKREPQKLTRKRFLNTQTHIRTHAVTISKSFLDDRLACMVELV